MGDTYLDPFGIDTPGGDFYEPSPFGGVQIDEYANLDILEDWKAQDYCIGSPEPGMVAIERGLKGKAWVNECNTCPITPNLQYAESCIHGVTPANSPAQDFYPNDTPLGSGYLQPSPNTCPLDPSASRKLVQPCCIGDNSKEGFRAFGGATGTACTPLTHSNGCTGFQKRNAEELQNINLRDWDPRPWQGQLFPWDRMCFKDNFKMMGDKIVIDSSTLMWLVFILFIALVVYLLVMRSRRPQMLVMVSGEQLEQIRDGQ
jgi:hypothetical protein